MRTKTIRGGDMGYLVYSSNPIPGKQIPILGMPNVYLFDTVPDIKDTRIIGIIDKERGKPKVLQYPTFFTLGNMIRSLRDPVISMHYKNMIELLNTYVDLAVQYTPYFQSMAEIDRNISCGDSTQSLRHLTPINTGDFGLGTKLTCKDRNLLLKLLYPNGDYQIIEEIKFNQLFGSSHSPFLCQFYYAIHKFQLYVGNRTDSYDIIRQVNDPYKTRLAVLKDTPYGKGVDGYDHMGILCTELLDDSLVHMIENPKSVYTALRKEVVDGIYQGIPISAYSTVFCTFMCNFYYPAKWDIINGRDTQRLVFYKQEIGAGPDKTSYNVPNPLYKNMIKQCFVVFLFEQFVGLYHIHQKQYVHGDYKYDNLLYRYVLAGMDDKTLTRIPVLIDFGQCSKVLKGQPHVCRGNEITCPLSFARINPYTGEYEKRTKTIYHAQMVDFIGVINSIKYYILNYQYLNDHERSHTLSDCIPWLQYEKDLDNIMHMISLIEKYPFKAHTDEDIMRYNTDIDTREIYDHLSIEDFINVCWDYILTITDVSSRHHPTNLIKKYMKSRPNTPPELLFDAVNFPERIRNYVYTYVVKASSKLSAIKESEEEEEKKEEVVESKSSIMDEVSSSTSSEHRKPSSIEKRKKTVDSMITGINKFMKSPELDKILVKLSVYLAVFPEYADMMMDKSPATKELLYTLDAMRTFDNQCETYADSLLEYYDDYERLRMIPLQTMTEDDIDLLESILEAYGSSEEQYRKLYNTVFTIMKQIENLGLLSDSEIYDTLEETMRNLSY